MKKLSFFLLLSFFLTPTFSFASALTRESQLVNQALNSSANTAFNDVRVINGTVTATVDQRVALAGSSAILSQPVSFAADYAAMARSAASLASRMAAGLAVPLAVGWAVKKLLDGADYVLGDGGKIIKKPDSDGGRYAWVGATAAYSDYQSALKNTYAHNINQGAYTQQFYNVTSVQACSRFYSSATSQLVGDACVYYAMNPYYNPDPPPQVEVTQQQTEDAFLTWMRNNPTSITDPVSQAMYTPSQTTGWNLTGEEGAHNGVDGITDEIAKNIIDHRNAELLKPKSYTLNDSTQPTTQTNPDGSSQTTTNNLDGSTTKKTTTTTTDPNTGKQTTTTTTTVTQPDGTSKTTTETTTTDATKTKTDIPAACDWFSIACDWFNWTQKDDVPENSDTDDKVQDDPNLPTLATNTFNFSGACPPPYVLSVPSLTGGSNTITYSFDNFCTWLVKLHPWVRVCGWITAICILTGYRSNSSE